MTLTALALASIGAAPGCAEMIANAGRDAVKVSPGAPLKDGNPIGVVQTVCSSSVTNVPCNPALVEGVTSRLRGLFQDACYTVVNAPELQPLNLGMAVNVPGQTVNLGLSPLGLNFGGTNGTPSAGIQFLLPPGVTEAILIESIKKYGIRALVSSTFAVGPPTNASGFLSARVTFTVTDVGSRALLLRGAFDGSLTNADQPDRDLNGLFTVLESGMSQKASLCPVAAPLQ